MANYQYSSDLIDDVLFRCGELTDGTSDFEAAALRYLNRAYQSLWMGGTELDATVNEDWYWLLTTTPTTLTLSPSITAGTVNVTNNDTAITFSSAPAASVAGWFFKTDNNSDVFRIATHTAASTSATLDSVYTQTTDTAAGYKLFKLDYTIPSDVLRLVSPMRVYRDDRREIGGMSLTELEKRWPLTQIQSGVPWAFAQLTETTVRFSHYGQTDAGDYIRVDFDYLQRPAVLTDSASEEPRVPWQYRKTLSDFATFWLLMDKNDNRADGIAMIAKAGLKAMVIENRHRWATWGRSMGHIYPRPFSLPENYGPLRTASGMIIA